jgi:hypothetical protein
LIVKPLRWHEPAAYRRLLFYEQGRAHPWRTIGQIAAAGFGLLILRGVVELGHLQNGQFPNRPGWPASIALAAALGIVIGYLLPRFLMLLPGSIVILSEKGVNNNDLGKGLSIRFWSWERIDHARISSQTVRDREFTVMSLFDNNGNELATLALRDLPSVAEIRAYFREHGKSCDISTSG